MARLVGPVKVAYLTPSGPGREFAKELCIQYGIDPMLICEVRHEYNPVTREGEFSFYGYATYWSFESTPSPPLPNLDLDPLYTIKYTLSDV
jgi:hypothetical protein